MIAKSERSASECVGTRSEVMGSQLKKRPIFGNEVPHRKRPRALGLRSFWTRTDIPYCISTAFLSPPSLTRLVFFFFFSPKHQYLRYIEKPILTQFYCFSLRFNWKLSFLFLLQTCSSLDALRQWLSNLSMHQNHLEDLLKHGLLGVTPRVSDSGGLGRSLRIWFLTSSQVVLILKVWDYALRTTAPVLSGLL